MAATHNTPGLKLNYEVVVLVRDFLQHALQFENVKTTAPDNRISLVVDGMTQYIQQALTGPQNDLPDAAGQAEANKSGVAVTPPATPTTTAAPVETKQP